jgi:hypothetical protein
MSTEKKQSEWLGKPSTRQERERHEALGDRNAQRKADLLSESLWGDTPATRRAAAAKLAKMEGR